MSATYATEYAKYYGIPEQREGESDSKFRSRVSGELRAKNKIIEAHEAYSDKPYDSDPLTMLGILGGVAEEMHGRHAPDPERQIGDDIAAGMIVNDDTPKPSAAELLLALFLR